MQVLDFLNNFLEYKIDPHSFYLAVYEKSMKNYAGSSNNRINKHNHFNVEFVKS